MSQPEKLFTEDRIESKKKELQSNRSESNGNKQYFIKRAMESLQDSESSRPFYEWISGKLPEPTLTRLLALTCEADWVKNKGAYFNRLAMNELGNERQN